MCNFIIRPIKCYATVDLDLADSGSLNPVKAGDALTVQSVSDEYVNLVRDNDTVVQVPLNVFVHTFSDKDPNAKESKKDSKS